MIREEPVAPLVLVLPDDRAETLLARIVQTGASRVQLLVPDGIIALQQSDEAARLSALTKAAGVELLLISSDPVTLEVARRRGIATMGVRDARVASPTPKPSPAPRPPAAPIRAEPVPSSASRPPAAPIRAEPAPAPAAPIRAEPAPSSTARPHAAPIRAEPAPVDPDLAFLDALDDLDVAQPPPRTNRPAAELAAAEASLDVALRMPPKRMSDEELLLAALDREPGMTPPRSVRPVAPEPYRDDPDPALQRPLAAPRPVARPQSAPTPRSNSRSVEATRAPLPVRRSWPVLGLALVLVALLVVIAGLMLWSTRVTVAVTLPLRPETVEPIIDLPVPLAPQGSDPATAVIAETLSADVSFASVGQVTEGTLTPAGTAGGTVTILNSTAQALLLPAGSEFLAITADGRQVPFVSGADTLVPAATTSDTGAQIVTVRGQASIGVAARSPGTGSNVEGNTIRRITPPGGAGFGVDAGSILLQHPPLTGGTEEEVRIVKDSDVQALLALTLEGLDAAGRNRLSELATARGLVLDPNTVLPKRSELEQLQGFELLIQPSIGQTLDPTSPNFSLTALARYSGLAIPPERPLNDQLGAALTEQLRLAGLLNPGDCRAPSVTAWRWDGERLLVSGEIRPDTTSPQCQGGLDPATLDQVRNAVRGQSREQATANLDALVAANLIGGYTLPPGERMPAWDWQIQIDS